MYKYHHGILPNILDMFEQNLNVHQYDTCPLNLLHVPCCQTEQGKRFCRYKAVITWNDIYKRTIKGAITNNRASLSTVSRNLKLNLISYVIHVNCFSLRACQHLITFKYLCKCTFS